MLPGPDILKAGVDAPLRTAVSLEVQDPLERLRKPQAHRLYEIVPELLVGYRNIPRMDLHFAAQRLTFSQHSGAGVMMDSPDGEGFDDPTQCTPLYVTEYL